MTVKILDHPLIQHKLTLLRQKEHPVQGSAASPVRSVC